MRRRGGGGGGGGGGEAEGASASASTMCSLRQQYSTLAYQDVWELDVNPPVPASTPTAASSTAAATATAPTAETQLLAGEASLRPHSTPATLKWLADNYELAEGVCIPRHIIYKHYCSFCQKNFMLPVNPASFGKIIRQQFRMVKNRRLGTRGCSTYHYYGIGIREDSIYFEEQYGKAKGSCNSGLRKTTGSQVAPPQQQEQPDFPSSDDFCLPMGISEEQFTSFLVMYRAHCQRIYDSVFRINLDEVKEFSSHFWSVVPLHLEGILGSNAVVNMVGICDSVLYRSICNAIMPSSQKTISVALLHLMKKLCSTLVTWLQQILSPLPKSLAEMKLNLARHFCRMLSRVISMHKVWFSASVMLQDVAVLNQMHNDWKGADLDLICRDLCTTEGRGIIFKLFGEFETLLQKQANLEEFLEWLRTVVQRCILQGDYQSTSFKMKEKQFLLMWARVGSLVIREMTLISARSFGSFHLLGILTNDYISHYIELLGTENKIIEMKNNIMLDIPPVLEFDNMLLWRTDFNQFRHENVAAPSGCGDSATMTNFAAGNRLVENGLLISNAEDLQTQNNITDTQGISRVGDLSGVMSNAQYIPMNEYVKPPGRNILQENYGQNYHAEDDQHQHVHVHVGSGNSFDAYGGQYGGGLRRPDYGSSTNGMHCSSLNDVPIGPETCNYNYIYSASQIYSGNRLAYFLHCSNGSD